MLCPHCNSQNPDDAVECTNCGAPLTEKGTQGKNFPEGIPSDFIELPDPSPSFTQFETPAAPEVPDLPSQTDAQAETTVAKSPENTTGIGETSRPAEATGPGRELAILLEILPGLMGFLGLGWIYAGNKKVGFSLLIGFLVWDLFALIIALVTGFTGCFCTMPINVLAIIVSVLMLNNYLQNK